jgi:hypothetical protein
MNTNSKPDIDYVEALYSRYFHDLKRVREFQQRLHLERARLEKNYSRWEKIFPYRAALYFMQRYGYRFVSVQIRGRFVKMAPSFDDIEAEITYLLVRDQKPENVVEISPSGGWSTSWILNALKDNGYGKLYSYDLVDNSTFIIPTSLSAERWNFIKGDIRQNVHLLPSKIDYLFMDSDHSKEFAHWYIKQIFPMLRSGITVSIHDVFQTSAPSDGEGCMIMALLTNRNIDYFTASRPKNPEAFRKICEVKSALGIDKLIHSCETNPMIFFQYAGLSPNSCDR